MKLDLVFLSHWKASKVLAAAAIPALIRETLTPSRTTLRTSPPLPGTPSRNLKNEKLVTPLMISSISHEPAAAMQHDGRFVVVLDDPPQVLEPVELRLRRWSRIPPG